MWTGAAIIKGIRIEKGGELSRKDLESFTDFVGTYGAKGLAWARVTADAWTSPIYKFLKPEEVQGINGKMGAGEGDVLVFVADTPKIVNDSLGNLRLHLGRKLNLIDPDKRWPLPGSRNSRSSSTATRQSGSSRRTTRSLRR